MSHKPQKEPQTVTTEGDSVKPQIAGLNLRPLRPKEDVRGELAELYSHQWNYHSDPLVYAYMVTLRPGMHRGWTMHMKQDDRIAVIAGSMTWALYDDRKDSPTHGLVNLLTFSERNRALMTIPIGVYHAVKNYGDKESMFLNFPTVPYDHQDPDKYRLPLENDLIPFSFSDVEKGVSW